MRFYGKIVLFLKDIKLEHTLFSLPFFLSGIIIAGNFKISDIFILLLGLISARISGMAWNRYVDREIDSLNPRTKNRPLARGLINPSYYKYITFINLFILFLVALYYNILCVILFPLVAVLIISYPYLKRYTYLSHIVLGIILSFAILGPYVALRNEISLEIMIISLAIIFWVAGFDVIYSLQDYDFDRKYNLKSIPVRFGKEFSKKISFIFHLITSIFILIFFYMENINVIYAIPLVFILILENILILKDEKHIKLSFQNLNIIFSILFLTILYFGFLTR